MRQLHLDSEIHAPQKCSKVSTVHKQIDRHSYVTRHKIADAEHACGDKDKDVQKNHFEFLF